MKKYLASAGDNDLFFKNSPRSIEKLIIDFINSMKNAGKSYFAIHNYLSCIISFYKINDIILNTKKLSKFLPECKSSEHEILVLTIRVIVPNGLLVLKSHIPWILVIYS